MASGDHLGNNGAFQIRIKSGVVFNVISSQDHGWEHVSVSLPYRAPAWDEMCLIKGMFWDKDDWVVQYHPAESEYIDIHPYCLHMWRPMLGDLPTPPSWMVGPKL